MKKIVLPLIITLLTISLGFSLYGNFKSGREIKQLKSSLSMSNKEVYELKSEAKDLEDRNKSLSENQQQKHPIDIELDKCMAKNPSTLGMSNCMQLAADQWSKEIEQSISVLQKTLTPSQVQLLDNSQAKWEEYKKAQFELNKDVIGSKDGSIYLNILDGANSDIVERRARELNGLLSDI